MVRVSAQDLTTTRLCKTPGCTNEANTAYDRGMYFGLCEDVCLPAERKRQGERMSEVAQRRSSGNTGVSNGRVSLVSELAALRTLADRADRMRTKAAARATAAVAAKREADAAERVYREALRAACGT